MWSQFFFCVAPTSNKASEKNHIVKPLSNKEVKPSHPKSAPASHSKTTTATKQDPPDTTRSGASTNRYDKKRFG